jgi:replicative DNA helicase
MNVEAVVIYLLLKSESREEALTRYTEVKREYFTPAYTSILQAISRFYDRHGKMPTLGELKLDSSRSPMLSISIASLETLDIPDITDFDLAIETLKDQYTQQQFLTLLSRAIDDISLKSSTEIMELANAIPVTLEESIKPSSYMHTAKDISIFKTKEDAAEEVMYTGISNKLDAEYGALRRGEVFLIGGRRGAGKSVICINIAKNSVEKEKLFVPYFSIEMSAEETMLRYVGISAGIAAIKVRNQEYDITDLEKMAKFRASMFTNGMEILGSCDKLVDFDDFVALELKLIAQGIEDTEKGIIIIDDPELKLSSIDMYLTNLKAKHGKKLGPVIVDYVNQIVVDGCNDSSMYDWKNQVVIAKRLKALARKHGVTIFAPYQIDDSGEARMAKGILDSCDFAYTVEAVHSKKEGDPQGALKWTGTKARSLPAVNFATGINWDTLVIDGSDISPQQLASISGVDVAGATEGEKPKANFKKGKATDAEKEWDTPINRMELD